jgi:MPBQ/MSBQ methyltransferase
MAKAQKKADLQGCTFREGDAENLPVASNTFDRYVSAGSIEYWPDPQRGIEEAFRVIKPGGRALLVGPLEPGNWFSRFFAELWMLFPKEVEYLEWFERAGFEEIETLYVRPHWHRSRTNQYGIAIAGLKPKTESSSTRAAGHAVPPKEKMTFGRRLKMVGRVIIGSIGGFIFIPIALLGYLYSALSGDPAKKSLNRHQIIALLILVAIIVAMLIWVS